MTIERDINWQAKVGDFDNGDGAAITMDRDGIRIEGPVGNAGSVEWRVWDAMVAEVERYRRMVAATQEG